VAQSIHRGARHGARSGGTINLLPLTSADYQEIFTPRWISKELADQSGIKRVISLDAAALIGAEGRPGDFSGLAIPYTLPGETAVHSWRLRRDLPDLEFRNGEQRFSRRYLSAPGSGNRAYFVPGTEPDQLTHLGLPVLFVEGELKSLAAWRLAHWDTRQQRFLPVGLSGVWNWRGVIGKQNDERGVRRPIKGVIADVERLAFQNREILISYDADVATNPDVRRARTLLSKTLLERGAAVVRWIEIPLEANAKGLDDLLHAWGPERVLDLIGHAASATAPAKSVSIYAAHDGRMWRRTVDRSGLEAEVPLCNFVARVIENRQIDNGVEEETQLVYRIRGQVNGSAPIEFNLPQARFREGDWPESQFGTSDAYTEIRAAEHVRRAIAEISLGAPRRVVYGHLGHRQIDGRRVYLHGPGAIASTGAVSSVETSLPLELARYELRLPTDDRERRDAICASLRTLACAPLAITVPALATTYRAPLGPSASVLTFLGRSGALKTALAAVNLQHFGRFMGWNGLNYIVPLTFSSTANSISEILFTAKDFLSS
jgi:hypothetical protein